MKASFMNVLRLDKNKFKELLALITPARVFLRRFEEPKWFLKICFYDSAESCVLLHKFNWWSFKIALMVSQAKA